MKFYTYSLISVIRPALISSSWKGSEIFVSEIFAGVFGFASSAELLERLFCLADLNEAAVLVAIFTQFGDTVRRAVCETHFVTFPA